MSADVAALIASRLRDVPDFPQPGIVFKDITPLLGDPVAFGAVIAALAAQGPYRTENRFYRAAPELIAGFAVRTAVPAS